MPAAISIENVTRSFREHFWQKQKLVLKNINLQIKQGEVFGFLGPNGAGKTTTIKIITGLIKPDAGQAEVLGYAAGSLNARKNIGFLPESPYFYEHLTGYEFLKIHARLHDMKNPREKIFELLEKVGLSYAVNNYLRSYSRGMLQRIGIAQAILADPLVLVLDEPLTGLDPIGRKDIKDIILEEKKKGKTIFFSSHILPDAEAVCDRIGIILKGEIKNVGELNHFLKKGIKTDEISLEEWFIEQVGESHA